MLKAKAAVLYVIQFIVYGGVALGALKAIEWSIEWPKDRIFIWFIWTMLSLILALMGLFHLPLRVAIRAWRAATIKLGDTAMLGADWYYRKGAYVPYEFLTVTVKNAPTRDNQEGGVTRKDEKHFAFGATGVVPLGESVRVIAFPDRSRVLVEYSTEREYLRDDELPDGTWFAVKRTRFITFTEDHHRTQKRLKDARLRKEEAELNEKAATEAEALLIVRSTGGKTPHSRD